ncbi:ParA family protein [Nocardiopsis sp. NPDC006198]|uniref:ParA family protein n=1 Tax=Nocardiopsis sp. NPDC006198 TaxID=3154472 RepID=UPI0033BA88EB
MPRVTVDVPDLSTVRRIVGEWLQRREDDLDAQEYACKVLAIINGKGGVGKTSFAVSWAVNLAAQGKKVLYVELDPQGNACEDLGINKTPLDDGGQAQVDAVLNQKPFQPTGEARPNLFIVPGGQALSQLVTEMHFLRRISDAGNDLPWQYLYLCSLDQCEDDYDIIVFDVAPGDEALQKNALHAADGLIVPTRSDPSSRKGLRIVAQRYIEVKEHNETLELLGVVLFATNASATKVQENLRKDLARDLGSAKHKVVPHPIRYVESAAVEARRRGKTPTELVRERPEGVPLKSLEALSADYSTVNTWLLTEVTAVNRQLNSPED